MPALVAGIDALRGFPQSAAWMAGTSPAMTRVEWCNMAKTCFKVPTDGKQQDKRAGMAYEGQLTEMVKFQGFKDDRGDAYYARPTRAGRYPGVVVIHHLPGWDEWIIEVTRKFAHHGYAAIAPHLYFRDGPGSPDDIGAKVRAAGGVADEQVVGDVAGAANFLRAQPNASGKVGIIGFCSGGRHAYLAGCGIGD